jgi:hypothetical protein
MTAAKPTVDGVLALIAALETLREAKQWLLCTSRCARCRAAVGAPCTRPDGSAYVGARGEPRYHAPRVSLYCAASNSALPRSWKQDLINYGVAPAIVLREIRRTRLYRLAMRDGRLAAVEVTR